MFWSLIRRFTCGVGVVLWKLCDGDDKSRYSVIINKLVLAVAVSLFFRRRRRTTPSVFFYLEVDGWIIA